MGNPLALIIEDHTDAAAIFQQALRAADFEAEIVRSGDVALDRLAAVTPDMVLLDLNLPRVSGAEILHYIRSDERLSGTCVVVATAHPHLAEALQDEADLVLIKPVSFTQLRNLASRLEGTTPSTEEVDAADRPSALVIEDHVDAAVIFTEALKNAGFQTETIRSGDVALVRLSDVVPTIVILDLNLPRVSGTEILRQIRADPRLAETKVIVATAHPHLAEDVKEAADMVLFKPVSFTQLRNLAMRLGSDTPESN